MPAWYVSSPAEQVASGGDYSRRIGAATLLVACGVQ